MHTDYHQCVYDCSIHVYISSGLLIHSKVSECKQLGVITAAPDVNTSFLKRRPVYANHLCSWTSCSDSTSPSAGARLRWMSASKDDTVVVTTACGKDFVSDVCIGAHDIGMSITGFDASPKIAVQDSGYAIARVAFPRSAIKVGSPASTLLTDVDIRPEFRTLVGNDNHLVLFLTADWVAIAFTHRVSIPTTAFVSVMRPRSCSTRTTTTHKSRGPISRTHLTLSPVSRRQAATTGTPPCSTSCDRARVVS